VFKVIKKNRPEIDIYKIFRICSVNKHPKTSCDGQVIDLFFWKIGVAALYGDVRILTRSSKVAVSVYAQ